MLCCCDPLMNLRAMVVKSSVFIYGILGFSLAVAVFFALRKDDNCRTVVNASKDDDVGVSSAPERASEHSGEDKLPDSGETNNTSTDSPVEPHIVKQEQVKQKWNVFTTSEKYNIVVMTYKRDDLLKRFLVHYNQKSFPHLEKIVVIWNNVGVPLNENKFVSNIPNTAPIRFIVAEKNLLRNRMVPRPEVTTNAVLMLDDDLIIPGPDVEFAFQTWKQFPHRIVGFIPRKHVYGADGSISYAVVQDKKGVPMSYSLILTGASIVHRDYFNMFGETVPPEIINMIDTLVDGEDLTFNVMVGDYLSRLGMPQTPGLLIGKVNVQFIADQAKSGFHGVSLRPNYWTQRYECLTRLNASYNGLPLPFSNAMVLKVA